MTLSPGKLTRIAAVLKASTDGFVELTRIAGLDPTQAFRGADLSGVDFKNEILDGFDFTDTNLSGADLRGTDLARVIGLHRARLDSVITDSATQWPTADHERLGLRKAQLIEREQTGKIRMRHITWRADPLVWGHGPRVFEVFLEPTCPFSVKTFGKLDELLARSGEDRVTIKIRLHSQPWHMYSGVIVRCILAASTLESGKDAAKAVMAAVAARREEFEFERHCSGSNLDATPNDIIARIERYSDVKLVEAFAIPDLDREIKWHCKYARQNGVHVSPTFMIDGLIQADMSSEDTVPSWVSRLLEN